MDNMRGDLVAALVCIVDGLRRNAGSDIMDASEAAAQDARAEIGPRNEFLERCSRALEDCEDGTRYVRRLAELLGISHYTFGEPDL